MVCLLNLDRKLARYLLRKEGIGVKIHTQWGRLCEKWISACARCGLKKWMCLSYCTPLFSRLMARQEFVHFYGRKMCRNRCSLVVPLIRYKTLYLLIWKIRYSYRNCRCPVPQECTSKSKGGYRIPAIMHLFWTKIPSTRHHFIYMIYGNT